MEAGTLNEGTRKLYYEDAYAVDFEAEVLSCDAVEFADGTAYRLLLDQTLFFPEEGGQSPDKGSLNGQTVLDVQIKEALIYHTVASAIAVGSKVRGIIDWHHRFSNMQQHSGEHLFSGVAHRYYGVENVGFHLSDREVTLDFDKPLTKEQLAFVEKEVNKAITENIASKIFYPTKEEENGYDYRSKIDIAGQVRLVEYPGYDLCACCAPHVARTGEIGLLKIMTAQNYKGGVRVSILCGRRAVEALVKEHDVLLDTARFLSAQPLEVYDLVTGLKNDIAALKRDIAKAEEERLMESLSAVQPEERDILLFFKGGDGKAVRNAVNSLMKDHGGYAAIFTGNDDDGYHFVIGSSENTAQTVLNALKSIAPVRGGGRPSMVEGSVQASRKAIEAAVKAD